MTIAAHDTLVVGRFGKCHGLQGWLKVHSYTEPAENILTYQPLYLERQDQLQEIKLTGERGQGDRILVQLEGCTNPEQAQRYTGLNIVIKRQQLEPLPADEYYWTDLQGLTVINRQNQVLGQVDYLVETGSNDVLVVKGEKEVWIPYLPEQVVLAVDLNDKTIRVDWPQA